METLITLGADVNACDNEGLTCLHHMVKNNNFEMVLVYLLAGADTNIRTKSMETVLHHAIKVWLRFVMLLLIIADNRCTIFVGVYKGSVLCRTLGGENSLQEYFNKCLSLLKL